MQVSVGDKDSLKGGEGQQQDLGGPTLLWGIQGGKVRALPESQKQRRGGVSYKVENLSLSSHLDSHPQGNWRHMEIIQSREWAD